MQELAAESKNGSGPKHRLGTISWMVNLDQTRPALPKRQLSVTLNSQVAV